MEAASIIFLLLLFSLMRSASPTLDPTEASVIKIIMKKLEKTNLDFSVDPCSGEGNWSVPDAAMGFESQIVCDCSSDPKSCRIITILLKGQNLSGILPPEFGQLTYLQQLDLGRNFINGSIPPSWATMKLQGLSLMGNRLSGPFPAVLTKITTLTNLSIEGNRFWGPIPPQIGNLTNMEKLVLSSNEFDGELPAEIAKLTNLTDLRISGNNFSGKIPDFIENLTKLEKLQIQGCGLEGPIPPGISALTNLSDLRISDLRGNKSEIPRLRGMTSLNKLILRNCSIHGNIPSDIGFMNSIKTLDLSFNQLTGRIPDSFTNLRKVDYMYLTKNMLTGLIPEWILKRNKNSDISYNNFTMGSSGPTQCLQGNINAVESYSSEVDTISTVSPCLKKDFPCSSSNEKKQYSLHINCGGGEVTINGTKYEADTEPRGASILYIGFNWAFSSTGNFMDDDNDADTSIALYKKRQFRQDFG